MHPFEHSSASYTQQAGAARKLRAVFFGTPQYAVPTLDALHEIAEICAVICQPDKPKGRGMALQKPAVKLRAEQLGLPVWQPSKLRDGALAAALRELQLDVALVIAYGRILPRDVLDAPRAGCINLHASLLPAYRGAAPIAWAVAHGARETGVTLMQMDEGMDTGPMLHSERVPIGEDCTQGEIAEQLAQLSAQITREQLARAVAGELVPQPQPEHGVSVAPILKKSDGRIDWQQSARKIHDLIRGMHPWPGGHCQLGARTLRVQQSRVLSQDAHVQFADKSPGTVCTADKHGVIVACGEGLLELLQVQPEGKRVMRAAEWVSGRGVAVGDVLT